MIEFRAIRQDEVETWIDLITLVFGGDYGKGPQDPGMRRMFANAWRYDPYRDTDGVLVAAEDGVLLSAVQVVKRSIYICGQEVGMGGIAAVCTRREARQQGLSARLLEMSIERMRDWELPVSLLQTGIHPHYRKHGWETVPFYHKALRLAGAQPRSFPEGVSARPLDFSTDLAQVCDLYASYASRFNGLVARREEYWGKFSHNPGGRWWVAERVDGIEAYLCIGDENEHMSGVEFGCQPGKEGLFDPLLVTALSAHGALPETGSCAAVLPSQYETVEWKRLEHWMMRLNMPLSFGGQRIDTTAALLELFSGCPEDERETRFTFWGNDGF